MEVRDVRRVAFLEVVPAPIWCRKILFVFRAEDVLELLNVQLRLGQGMSLASKDA
jgi:hypothetical protein